MNRTYIMAEEPFNNMNRRTEWSGEHDPLGDAEEMRVLSAALESFR